MNKIPDKIYFKIGEVCQICRIEPHVLRYWETEFTSLRPTKNKAGQRIYRRDDLDLIEGIKHLLYDQGYTIAGANKRLIEEGAPSPADPPSPGFVSEVKEMLEGVLGLLDGKPAARAKPEPSAEKQEAGNRRLF